MFGSVIGGAAVAARLGLMGATRRGPIAMTEGSRPVAGKTGQ